MSSVDFGVPEDIPLSTLVQDQQPVADFITKLVKDSYGAKTIKNYFGVIKMVVASAKDKATRKPLYPVTWDNDVLLVPRVNAKKQNRPTFTDKQVSQIIERAEGQYKVLFAVLAASGLRISELLGLRIEKVLDDCYRLRIIEKNYAGRQEDRLKTVNAERSVELHSTAAQRLRSLTFAQYDPANWRPIANGVQKTCLAKGWSVAYGKKRMPKSKELLKFGERWRPYRTVASWYMWRAFERAGYKVTNKFHSRPGHKRKSRKSRGKGSNGKLKRR